MASQPKSKHKRRWSIAAGVVFVVGTFLLYAASSAPLPETPRAWFKLQEVRALAQGGGPLPERIDVANVAESQNPRCVVLGLSGCADMRFVGYSYRLSSPAQVTVIEAPADERTLRENLPWVSVFRAQAYALSQRWLSEADVIVATHEHFDHITGLVRHPDSAKLAKRAFIPRAQYDSPLLQEAGFDDERVRAQLRPQALSAPKRIAPGVVAIPAGGHTQGSIWLYVRLQSGRELLFVGDTAWRHENIDLPRGTPRAVSWGLRADGDAVADQLAFLHQLQEEHPELALVSSHDPLHNQRLIDDGTFHDVTPAP